MDKAIKILIIAYFALAALCAALFLLTKMPWGNGIAMSLIILIALLIILSKGRRT